MRPQDGIKSRKRWRITCLTRDIAVQSVRELLALFNDFPELEWTRDNLLHELPMKWELSLIAFDDQDQPIGLIICSRKKTAVYVHLMLVSTVHRRSGVGSELLMQVVDRAIHSHKAFGPTSVQLQTNTTWTAAIEFYRRNGFRIIGDLGSKQRLLQLDLPNRGVSL